MNMKGKYETKLYFSLAEMKPSINKAHCKWISTEPGICKNLQLLLCDAWIWDSSDNIKTYCGFT